MTAMAIGTEGIISLVTAKNWGQRKHMVIAHLLIALPFLITIFLWVATSPDRFAEFLRVLDNRQIPYLMLGWNLDTYLPFYPRGIVYLYGLTIPVGIFLLVSWIFSLYFIRIRETRLLWSAFTINVAILAPHFNNIQERYVAPNAPFLFILAALILVDAVRRSMGSPWWIRAVLGTAIGAIGINMILALPNLPTRVFGVGVKTIYAVAFNQPDVNAFTWFNYDMATWGKMHPSLSREKPDDIFTWLLPQIDVTKPVYLKGRFTEFSPPYFLLWLLNQKDHSTVRNLPYTEYFVTLTVLSTSRYYTYEYRLLNEWVQWEVDATTQDPSLTLIDSKLFSELGIRVSIYGRPQ
jgi:hypothetical protein